MNTHELTLLYDLLIHKIQQLQNDNLHSKLEQECLSPITNVCYDLVGEGHLISIYSDLNLCRYLKATLFKIQNELHKVNPDLKKIQQHLDIPMKVMDQDEMETYLGWTSKEMTEDLDTLLKETKQIAKDFPIVIKANKVSEEMKDDIMNNLEKLKNEISKEMKL